MPEPPSTDVPLGTQVVPDPPVRRIRPMRTARSCAFDVMSPALAGISGLRRFLRRKAVDSRHAPFAGHCDFSSQGLRLITTVRSGLSPSATPRTFRLEERGSLQDLTSPVACSAPTGVSTSDPRASTCSEELAVATTDQTRTAPTTACYRRHAHDPGRLRPARSTPLDVK